MELRQLEQFIAVAEEGAIPLEDRSMVWRIGVVAPPEEHTTAAARELLSLLTQP